MRFIESDSDITSKEDLETALKDALTGDLCVELVNLAYSEDGYFDTDVFLDNETFFESLEVEEVYDVVRSFFFGEDLDSKGPANPTREYFRYNGYANVESTDDPGSIYMDELDSDIIDYIMEHLDDREYPDEIQEILDRYIAEED